MSTPREIALLEAVRVRPNAAAIKELRNHLEAFRRVGRGRRESMQIGALALLLEMHDKVCAVLSEHRSTP